MSRATDTTMVVNLEGIPREVVDAFKARLRAEIPPVAMRWKITELMAAYAMGRIRVIPDAEPPEMTAAYKPVRRPQDTRKASGNGSRRAKA